MIKRRNFIALGAVTFPAVAYALPIQKPELRFPTRPIRFVIPLAAGGSAELLARLVGEHMSKRLSQAVIVDLRPGGGTVIGSNLVAHAAPDGYTILMAANSLAINSALHRNLPYDGIKAFEPIALLADSPQVLAVSMRSVYQSLEDWLSASRRSPGATSLCSLGPATTQHIAAEMLQQKAGIRLTYVPYSGGALAVNAVLGGHVDAVLANLAEVSAHIEAGNLLPLAVTSSKRQSSLPNIPTVAESGFPGFEAMAWFGISAPSTTPHNIVSILSDAVAAALRDPEIRAQLTSHGLIPDYLDAAAFDAHIVTNLARYEQIVAEGKIQIE